MKSEEVGLIVAEKRTETRNVPSMSHKEGKAGMVPVMPIHCVITEKKNSLNTLTQMCNCNPY